jgi:hypothetical protein
MKFRTMAAYAAGVVTAPAWFYVFRKKLGPLTFEIVADETMDKTLQEVMLMRNDFQDIRTQHGEKAKQLKAQGYSNEGIAKELGIDKHKVRWALSDPIDESKFRKFRQKS